MIKLWLNNTKAGSLFDGDSFMPYIPRIGEKLSVKGYRYQVSDIIHEERVPLRDGWTVHIILAELGPS